MAAYRGCVTTSMSEGSVAFGVGRHRDIDFRIALEVLVVPLRMMVGA
jgi:hypothetical protein